MKTAPEAPLKTWVARVRAPTADWDELSQQLWEIAGLLGIEESPSHETSFFVPDPAFEILEFGSEAARRCAQWLEQDAFGRGGQVYARVYVDRAEALDPLKDTPGLEVLDFVEMAERDYSAEYKKSVRGVSFGEGLWVGPPWCPPPAGSLSWIVEPGLAFGTGEHPTTQLCLELLHALSRDPGWADLSAAADVGCGSGILAAALRRFFPRAKLWMCDLDPLCHAEVAKTFGLNSLSLEGCQGFFGAQGTARHLRTQTPPLPLLVSNIYAEVLAKISSDIEALLCAGGRWIASGILQGESEKILLESLPPGAFRVLDRQSRALLHPCLDSRQGLQEAQETWVAYVFERC